MYFFHSFLPPTLDDSIWQELLIKKNPDCLCATRANLSGEMMFFAQQFLFSTECQHEENSWSNFLVSIQAWWPRNKSLQKETEAETNKESLTKKRTTTFVRCYFQLIFLNECIQSLTITLNSLTTWSSYHQSCGKASYQVVTRTTT